MDTLNDYLNATPAEQDAEREKRGWTPRPPIVHTHRKPGRITDADIIAHRRKEALRTEPPTHRGERRPIAEEFLAVTAQIGAVHA